MTDLEIIKNTRPLLERTVPIDFSKQSIDEIADFSIGLCKLMWKEMALGLAANQVGVNQAIFAMIGEPESFVCINPRITNTYTEAVELEETSLSYPGLVIDKTRPKHIRLRFQAPNGESFTKVFTGITSRIVQQMVDHLNGVPFWDGVSKLKFDLAVRKARKLGFDYSSLPYKSTQKSAIIQGVAPKEGFFFA